MYVPLVGECLKEPENDVSIPPAINGGRVQMAATVWLTPQVEL